MIKNCYTCARVKTFIIVLLAFNTYYSANAAETPLSGQKSRTLFELNSDMIMFANPTSKLVTGWQNNFNALLQTGFDAGCDVLDLKDSGRKLERTGYLLVFMGVSIFFNNGFSLTAHDLAHMETARAIGGSNIKLTKHESSAEISVLYFFLNSFGYGSEPGEYNYIKNNQTPIEGAYVTGQGLNTNFIIADNISQKINRQRGQISDIPPYLLNKAWGMHYFTGNGPLDDGSNYINFLHKQGFEQVHKKRIIYLNAASLVLSGGSINAVNGTYDFITTGRTDVEPAGIKAGRLNVFWPEITTWLNQDNVSISNTINIKWGNNITILFSNDTPVLGKTDQATDFTIGSEIKIARLTPEIYITSGFNGFPFIKGGFKYDMTGTFSAGITGFYGRKNTMCELREHPSGPGGVVFLRVQI